MVRTLVTGKHHGLYSCKVKKDEKEWLCSFCLGLSLGNEPSLESVREADTVFSVTYSRIGQNLLVQDDATDVPNT